MSRGILNLSFLDIWYFFNSFNFSISGYVNLVLYACISQSIIHVIVSAILLYGIFKVFYNLLYLKFVEKWIFRFAFANLLKSEDFRPHFTLGHTYSSHFLWIDLIKIHMNANIMNTQIFHFNKYDLKGHWRWQKFIQFQR